MPSPIQQHLQKRAMETLIYNALGQRIETSGGAAGAVLYAYDEAGHLLGEYDGAGALIEETVWLGDIPVATLRPHTGGGVDIYYVHTDQLNTPRSVTRPSDNLAVWSWYSDPFGTDAANENPAGAGAFKYDLRFAGQIFDGLHANGFRDCYDPAIGRYCEPDPIGVDATIRNPALQVGVGMLDDFDDDALGGLNALYPYANNDPLETFDSTGLAGQRGRGVSGGSSGKGTAKPYKHCVEDPTDPNFIICKDKTTGKKIRKPKPADWPKAKMEACSTCQTAADVVVVGGVGYIVYRCVRMLPSLAPPLWWTIPENALLP